MKKASEQAHPSILDSFNPADAQRLQSATVNLDGFNHPLRRNPSNFQETMKRCQGLLILIQIILLSGCGEGNTRPVQQVMDGEARQGEQLVRRYGCAGCHILPGSQGTTTHFGPPLNAFAGHTTIAGAVPNQPENLVFWLQQPQAVKPGTAMPNLGIQEAEARHIAAFLYTLR